MPSAIGSVVVTDAHCVIESSTAAGIDLSLVHALGDCPLKSARQAGVRGLGDHRRLSATVVVGAI